MFVCSYLTGQKEVWDVSLDLCVKIDRSKRNMNTAVLQFLCSSWRCILPTYNTHLPFIICADSSLFVALSLPLPVSPSSPHISENLYSVQLTWMVFYWRKDTTESLLECRKLKAKHFLHCYLITRSRHNLLCALIFILPNSHQSHLGLHMTARRDQSEEGSWERSTFLKLTPSPTSMEITVKSDKNGGDILLPWEQAGHDRWQGIRASFSERQCLSVDRFCKGTCYEEQPAWAVSLREEHCFAS